MTEKLSRSVTPHDYFYSNQPSGDPGGIYVNDTIRGSGVRQFDRMEKRGKDYAAIFGTNSVILTHQTVYTTCFRHLPPEAEEVGSCLHTYLLDEVQGIDYTMSQVIRESDSFSHGFTLPVLASMISEAARRFHESQSHHRRQTGRQGVDSRILERVGTIRFLADLMIAIDDGDYDEAALIVDVVEAEIKEYREALKKALATSQTKASL